MTQVRIKNTREVFAVPLGSVLIVTPSRATSAGRATLNTAGITPVGPWTITGGSSTTIGPFSAFADVTVESTSGTVFAEVTSAASLTAAQVGAKAQTAAAFDALSNLIHANGSTGLRRSGVGLMNRRSKWGINTGSVYVDFLSGWVNNGNGASTAVVNTGTGLYGNNSATLTLGAGASQASIKKSGVSLTLQSTDVLTLVVDQMSGITNNDQFRIELSSDGLNTKSALLAHVIKTQRGSQLIMSFVLSDASLNGGELLTNTFNYIGVRLTSSTVGATCRVLGVLLNTQARPKLIVDFDDGFREQYTRVYRRMAKYGIVGNIGIIARTVGKNAGDVDTHDYCSLSQLQEMEAAGWDMAVHGYWNHNDASFTSRALLLADVQSNQNYVLQNFSGRAAYHYIFPGGVISTPNDSLGVLAQCGFLTARTVDANPMPTYPLGMDIPYAMWSRDISDTTGIAAITTMVDRAIATGSTVRIHGHRAMATVTDANNEVTITEWDSVVDMLRDRIRDGLIDNETISSWYQGAV